MTPITTVHIYGKILTFSHQNVITKIFLTSYIDSNIRGPILLSLLNSLEKAMKCLASLTNYRLSPTHLINSVKHEHSSKILYYYKCSIVVLSFTMNARSPY